MHFKLNNSLIYSRSFGISVIYNNKNFVFQMFGCGQSNYVIWSYIFNRELRADKLKILWDYEKNHFTIKLDFIGCPAYTSNIFFVIYLLFQFYYARCYWLTVK